MERLFPGLSTQQSMLLATGSTHRQASCLSPCAPCILLYPLPSVLRRRYMNNWLSLADLVQRLQISEPTIHRYAQLFCEYLPHRTVGGVTVYAPDTEVILTRISRLDSQDRGQEEILDLLAKEFPKNIEKDPDSRFTKKTPIRTEAGGELQKKLFQFLEIVSDQSKKIEALMERDNQMTAQMVQLRQELEQERAQRQRLERTSSHSNKALLRLYHSHKEHRAMILDLRAAPMAAKQPDETMERINARMDQLEDMFLDDMGRLQQLMHHVLKKTTDLL